MKLLLSVFLLAAVVPPARADGCPEARRLRLAGAFVDAERTARDCYATDPDDVGTWLELSRSLAAQHQLDAAAAWVDRGLVRRPDDVELQVWRSTILGWSEADAALVDVIVEPRIATGGAADLLATRLTLLAHPSHAWRLGVATEVRARDAVAETGLEVLGSFSGDTFSLAASVGADVLGPGPTFNAWIEPGLQLSSALAASIRYWRLDFADSAANILNPRVVATFGPVAIDLAYWLALPDVGAVTHAGLLRTRFGVAAWTFEAGFGGGNATDYLDPRSGDATHWLGLLGVAFAPSTSNRFGVSYTQRHEQSGTATALRHTLTLSWQLTL